MHAAGRRRLWSLPLAAVVPAKKRPLFQLRSADWTLVCSPGRADDYTGLYVELKPQTITNLYTLLGQTSNYEEQTCHEKSPWLHGGYDFGEVLQQESYLLIRSRLDDTGNSSSKPVDDHDRGTMRGRPNDYRESNMVHRAGCHR